MAELNNKKRIFLVDGYGFIFRAFHSLPPLTRKSDGMPVGAVYGFINMITKLLKMVEDHSYKNYLAMVFDSGRETFRNNIYQQYKANRQEPPDELKKQFPIMREVAESLSIKVIEQIGFEADDLIATYAKVARDNDAEVIIVSSDKDLMQLIRDGVRMFDPLKNVNIGPDEVVKKFGVGPDKVIDMLGMIGDSSDNIPGIPGIGPKTALELITEFGSLENVLNNTDKIKQKKRAEVITNNKEMALLSKRLVTLDWNVPLTCSFDELEVVEVDYKKFADFLRKYEFTSMLSKIERFSQAIEPAPYSAETAPPASLSASIKKIETEAELGNFIKEIRPEKNCFLHHIQGEKQKLVIGFENNEKLNICYFEVAEKKLGSMDLFSAEQNGGIAISAPILKKMFEAGSIKKIIFDVKSFTNILLQHDVLLDGYDCILTLSNTIYSSAITQEFASISEHLSGPVIKDEESEENFLNIIKTLHYLYNELRQKIFSEKIATIYEKIEKPLTVVLAKIENNGVKVNEKFLNQLSQEFEGKIKNMEAEIFKAAGREFNVGSPKQLSEVLFGGMGLPPMGKKSKSGSYSTGADVLEKLAVEGHKITTNILEWRQISKLKSTYTDALVKVINPKTGRIHTTFLTSNTATGRLSSHDPNLQNIPIRSEEGKKIRAAFIAEPGNKLISADYSQIELRLLAHAANMPTLKEAFAKGEDIHKITAHQVFGMPLEQITPDLRRAAKTINFGIIYGQSAYGLAAQLGIPVSDADKYIKSYLEKYPGIRQYMEKYKEFARQHGYVTTFFGRKCHISGVNDRNFAMRGSADRAAINYPLQGSAADIIKKAMVQLQNFLEEKAFKSRIILQVHDELLVEAPENEVETIARSMKKIMENSVNISVPIVVDVKSGDNWGEMH